MASRTDLNNEEVARTLEKAKVQLPEADRPMFVRLLSTALYVQSSLLPDQHVTRYCQLLIWLIKCNVVDPKTLVQELEEPFLEKAGLISKQEWNKKKVHINTRNLYTQEKYNLLRE